MFYSLPQPYPISKIASTTISVLGRKQRVLLLIIENDQLGTNTSYHLCHVTTFGRVPDHLVENLLISERKNPLVTHLVYSFHTHLREFRI